MVNEKLRRLGKVGSIVGFGFFIFAGVFYVSLPYARFKDLLASRVAGFGYDMEVEHAGPSLGLGMSLRDVSLVSRHRGAGKPTRILIEKATLDWSLLSYLFGTKSYSVSADVFGGDVDVKMKMGKDDTTLRARAKEVDLAQVPWVKEAINLPLSGKLDFKMDVGLPKQRASEAKGTLSWTCSGCTLGDGKAKLVIASNPMLADGLGLPKIRLGDLSGKIAIDKGVGHLQNVQVKSQDIEVTVEGEIHLAQPIATSHVDLYVRFKPSDSLLRSSEKLRTIMDLTAQMGKRPDGFIGFRATGSFQQMGSVQWLKTSPFVGASAFPKPVPPARGAASAPPRRPAPPPRPFAMPAPVPAQPPVPAAPLAASPNPVPPSPPPPSPPPPAPPPTPLPTPSPTPTTATPPPPPAGRPPAPPTAPSTTPSTAPSTTPSTAPSTTPSTAPSTTPSTAPSTAPVPSPPGTPTSAPSATHAGGTAAATSTITDENQQL